MVIIDVELFKALILDLDGVVTQTASLHARTWKRLFDELLAQRAVQTGAAFKPFDDKADYRHFVDGKSRIAGLLSFLRARSVNLPMGAPGDDAEQMTAHGLAARKDRYFAELLVQGGVQAFAPTVGLLQEAHKRGMGLAVASSSHHCREILQAANLTGLFDVRVDGIDLDQEKLRGKPAPDMFLEAARRLDVPPARGVVFEDSTAGIVAAVAGGFGLVIGVGNGTQAVALRESGASQVVVDCTEVRLHGFRGAKKHQPGT